MGEIRSKRCEGRELTKDQLVDELVRHPLLHPLVDSLDADYAAAAKHFRDYLRVSSGPDREARVKLFFCEHPIIFFTSAAAVVLGLLRTVYYLLPRLSKWLAAAICARYVVRFVSPYIKTK